MTTVTTLYLDPLDGLFFRDGRPFGAGNSATSGLPEPQTLAGALRTALMQRLGCKFEQLGKALAAGKTLAAALVEQPAGLAGIADFALRGPWLARANEPLLPAPLILHREKGGKDPSSRLHLLAPLKGPLPGWRETAETPNLCPLWAATSALTEPVGGFVTMQGMNAVLSGKAPDANQLVHPSELYEIDRRVGLAINNDRLTGEDGMLYTAGFLRLKPGVSFVAEIENLTDELKNELKAGSVIAWGGEGRRVGLTLGEAPLSCPVTPPDPAPDRGGTLLVLTTPAFLDQGWQSSAWQPLAAAVRGSVAVSGWDLARRTQKPTRFAAPAGSCFFFAGEPPTTPARGLADDEDRRLGYGCILKGVWHYA